MTSRSPGTSSRTSYVYSSRRPRNDATKANCEPTASGGVLRHSALAMFTYHSGALEGSDAYRKTSSRRRAISISVTTSTDTPRACHRADGSSVESKAVLGSVITAMVTPFRADGTVDVERFCE